MNNKRKPPNSRPTPCPPTAGPIQSKYIILGRHFFRPVSRTRHWFLYINQIREIYIYSKIKWSRRPERHWQDRQTGPERFKMRFFFSTNICRIIWCIVDWDRVSRRNSELCCNNCCLYLYHHPMGNERQLLSLLLLRRRFLFFFYLLSRRTMITIAYSSNCY